MMIAEAVCRELWQPLPKDPPELAFARYLIHGPHGLDEHTMDLTENIAERCSRAAGSYRAGLASVLASGGLSAIEYLLTDPGPGPEDLYGIEDLEPAQRSQVTARAMQEAVNCLLGLASGKPAGGGKPGAGDLARARNRRLQSRVAAAIRAEIRELIAEWDGAEAEAVN